MPFDLISRLKQRPMLCDGAMGTLLYAKGIFINRCYDELNLAMPDLIREIHHDYFQAGAEIVETNTFGANSFRLARHGCAEKTKAINIAGAQLVREAAKAFNGLVAGSVGPLGVRIEPLGKTSLDEAHAAFLEQICRPGRRRGRPLILETFGYLDELRQAIRAARDVNPGHSRRRPGHHRRRRQLPRRRHARRPSAPSSPTGAPTSSAAIAVSAPAPC